MKDDENIQIDSSAKQQPAKHLEVIERAPPGPAITKVSTQNPNFEFFQMCLLSFKLNNQDLDEILELDLQALFTKCTVEHKKPFQDFQEWISKEVYKIRFKRQYNANKKNLEEKRKGKDDMHGIKLVKEFKVYQDYFWAWLLRISYNKSFLFGALYQ